MGRGKPWDVYLASVFHGDEPALNRAILRGSVKKYFSGGLTMCMDVIENVVHRKGWKEGTSGKGMKRQVEDADLDSMAALLKNTEWDFPALSGKQQAQLEDGKLPTTLSTNLNLALNVNIVEQPFSMRGKVVYTQRNEHMCMLQITYELLAMCGCSECVACGFNSL